MLQRRLSICKQLIDWPPTRRFFAPKLSGRQIIKKTRPSLLTYFRRRFTLHTSQQTTALHPSEGRRTEGGKGPASRWRSAIQMFWLLLAAGGCITRWVPSDRTGRPGLLQVSRLDKHSGSAGGSAIQEPFRPSSCTHGAPSRMGQRAAPLGKPRKAPSPGVCTGVRQTGLPRTEKPTAQAACP